MALNAGDNQAKSGMAKAIFDALRSELESQFPDGEAPEETVTAWQKLSYAMAKGVVDHILASMEIQNIYSAGRLGDEAITVEQTDETTGKVK